MQPHEVLGVRPEATAAEVTDAFRRFALQHHPDQGGDPVRFQAGLEAYRRIIRFTPNSRRACDPPSGADVVFHRRMRPGVASLLRLAGRRFAAIRYRP